MVQQPVEQADGGGVFGQELAPGLEGPVASDAQCSSFVGGGDDAEQQLCAGVVERCEADLVDQDQLVAKQGVDYCADAVVGEAAVEGFDELGGGEVADPVSGVHGGDASATSMWLLPVPAGPTRQRFSWAVIHSRLAR